LMRRAQQADLVSAAVPQSVVPSLDVERGVGMMGSEESLRKILKTVLDNMAKNLPEIETSSGGGDVPTANRMLHAIKGYVPIFATGALIDHVTEVEKLSKTEPASVVMSAYADLAPQLRGLLDEIKAFLGQD